MIRRIERAAEIAATAVLGFGAVYIFGHVVAAWLRGSFEVIAR